MCSRLAAVLQGRGPWQASPSHVRHRSVSDLLPTVRIIPPNTIQKERKKKKNRSALRSITCIGCGQSCLKPRGTDIWDKFPGNLAVKTDSKTSRVGSVPGKGGASRCPRGSTHGTACSRLENRPSPARSQAGQGPQCFPERVSSSKFRAQTLWKTV